ncbi:unnamed protein product [Arctogadus glacialis]
MSLGGRRGYDGALRFRLHKKPRPSSRETMARSEKLDEERREKRERASWGDRQRETGTSEREGLSCEERGERDDDADA